MVESSILVSHARANHLYLASVLFMKHKKLPLEWIRKEIKDADGTTMYVVLKDGTCIWVKDNLPARQ